MVPIFPGDVRLGFGNLETAFDELFCGEVEFTDHAGVTSASREPDEGSFILGTEELLTLVDPVLIFVLGQLIKIQNFLPLFGAVEVVCQQHPAEKPANILFISPEIVDMLAHELGIGELFFGVEDFKRLLFDLPEKILFLIFVEGDFVLSFDPVEGLFALNLFQPEIGIGRCASVLHGDRCYTEGSDPRCA